MATIAPFGGMPDDLVSADDFDLPTPLFIIGTGAADVLHGGAGDDVISAGAGDDVLDGGLGNDTLDGGEGRDTVYYQRATSGVTVDLSIGIAVSDGLDRLISIENVVGSAFDDYVKGDDGANWLMGWGGHDLLVGGAGNDTLIGGTGDDTIVGGSGFDTVSYRYATNGVVVNLATGYADGDGYDLIHDVEAIDGGRFGDLLIGNSDNNLIHGSDGNDTLIGGAGSDTLIGGAGDDSMDGGSGLDTVSYATAAGGVTVDLAAGTATGQGTDIVSGFETVIGSAFDDVLIGDDFANMLVGGAGDDMLRGGGGSDTLLGGSGNDTLDGGAGFDVANFSSSAAAVHADLAAGLAIGDGTDVLISIEGLFGSAHNDVLRGDAGNNWLWGGDGDDVLDGGAGHDNLRGGAGNDTLHGGAGYDMLIGGEGADVFVVTVGTFRDEIRDFEVGTDIVGLYGFAITDFAALQSRFEQVGADTVIRLSSTDSLILTGIDADILSAGDFQIAPTMPADLLSGGI